MGKTMLMGLAALCAPAVTDGGNGARNGFADRADLFRGRALGETVEAYTGGACPRPRN